MLATVITTHVQDALNRLLQQYKDRPNIAAVLTAFVSQIQEIEYRTFELDHGRQFFDGVTYPSVGAQLDGIGQLVNVNRNGLDDAEYLVFIIGTIAENFSDTTRDTLLTIIQNFFPGTTILAHDMPPAEFNFEMSTPTTPQSLFHLIFPIIQNSLGAGIGLGFISVFVDDINGFVVGDDDGNGDGLGFSGDDGAGNPTGPGGLFASDIYVNVSA